MLNIASLALAVLATARPVSDTTISVKSGTRLVVDNFAGSIVIDSWNKNAIRIQAEHSRRAELEIEQGVARLDVSAHGKWGEPTFVDYTITVPNGTALELSGIDTDIEVRGGQGAIKAETVKGDVSIKGAKGTVSCSSVEGEVEVENCQGRIEASGVNELVRVVGATGEVQAESVNGDVFLEQGKSASIEGSTVNGDVYFSGTIQKEGDYSFSTHNGNIWVAVGEDADCSGSVSTYGGSFESSFPVERSDKRKRKGEGDDFTFTIGEGSSRLELEAFNGNIRLDRPQAIQERIAQVHGQREMRESMKRKTKDINNKDAEMRRKIEEKEMEIERKQAEMERKMEQKAKQKEKHETDNEEDDDDKSPNPN